jgi:hypothetical protein
MEEALNPVIGQYMDKAVQFLATPISGKPGELTWGTMVVVIVMIAVIHVWRGGKLW